MEREEECMESCYGCCMLNIIWKLIAKPTYLQISLENQIFHVLRKMHCKQMQCCTSSPNDCLCIWQIGSFQINHVLPTENCGNTRPNRFFEVIRSVNMDVNPNCASAVALMRVMEEKGFDDNFILNLLKSKSSKRMYFQVAGGMLLRKALLRPMFSVALKLLKLQIDVNMKCFIIHPLFYAIKSRNIDAVIMLLYFGANVDVVNEKHQTPIMAALEAGCNDIAEILVDFYSDFSCSDRSGTTALHLAAELHAPLAVTLIEKGADVNVVDHENRIPIQLTVTGSSSVLFQLLLRRMSSEFFSTHINNIFVNFLIWDLSNSEWMECFNLIAQYAPFLIENNSHLILTPAVKRLIIKYMQEEDRLAVIYTCLSLGCQVQSEVLKIARRKYKLGDEYYALVYAFDGCACCLRNIHQDDTSEWQLRYVNIGYRFLPRTKKEEVVQYVKQHYMIYNDLLDWLEVAPSVPSLLELCRDASMKLINSTIQIDRLYQFYDYVKDLEVPEAVKEILRYERQIYC